MNLWNWKAVCFSSLRFTLSSSVLSILCPFPSSVLIFHRFFLSGDPQRKTTWGFWISRTLTGPRDDIPSVLFLSQFSVWISYRRHRKKFRDNDHRLVISIHRILTRIIEEQSIRNAYNVLSVQRLDSFQNAIHSDFEDFLKSFKAIQINSIRRVMNTRICNQNLCARSASRILYYRLKIESIEQRCNVSIFR